VGPHSRLTVRLVAGLSLTVAAVVILTLRIQSTVDYMRGTAAAEVGRNDEGGALAAADMVGLNDDFVRAAIHVLPRSARFAALVPDPFQAQKTYGVSPTTIEAVPDLMREVLLPRREVVTPGKGTYIVCYLCDTSPWDRRTHWLWRGSAGGLIGLVYR
jgi:hypothetical protein